MCPLLSGPWYALQRTVECAHSGSVHCCWKVGIAGDTALCTSVNGCDFSHSPSVAATPNPQVPEVCGGLLLPPLLDTVTGAPKHGCRSSRLYPSLLVDFYSAEDSDMNPKGAESGDKLEELNLEFSQAQDFLLASQDLSPLRVCFFSGGSLANLHTDICQSLSICQVFPDILTPQP